MRVHIGIHSEKWNKRIPLCGQAMWDELTTNDLATDCWECAAIAGVSAITHPHLQPEGGETT